jgi:hypothetical protein
MPAIVVQTVVEFQATTPRDDGFLSLRCLELDLRRLEPDVRIDDVGSFPHIRVAPKYAQRFDLARSYGPLHISP